MIFDPAAIDTGLARYGALASACAVPCWSRAHGHLITIGFRFS